MTDENQPNMDPSEIPTGDGVTAEKQIDAEEITFNIYWELTKFGIAMGFLSGVAATVLFYEYAIPSLF